MRNLIFLLILAVASACSSAKLNTLQAENDALRAEVLKLAEANQQFKQLAELEASNAREAEAQAKLALEQATEAARRAHLAETEAIKQKEAALKALKDCKGK